MLRLSSTLRIFLAVERADMRKGFDGLAQLARDRIAQDPLPGQLFVSRNRRRDRIKILDRDRYGFALWLHFPGDYLCHAARLSSLSAAA